MSLLDLREWVLECIIYVIYPKVSTGEYSLGDLTIIEILFLIIISCQ